MRKIAVGDVFEIITPKGKVYLQYVYCNKSICELIRILPGFFADVPDNLQEVINSKELFLIHFPLKAALKKKIVFLLRIWRCQSISSCQGR